MLLEFGISFMHMKNGSISNNGALGWEHINSELCLINCTYFFPSFH